MLYRYFENTISGFIAIKQYKNLINIVISIKTKNSQGICYDQKQRRNSRFPL